MRNILLKIIRIVAAVAVAMCLNESAPSPPGESKQSAKSFGSKPDGLPAEGQTSPDKAISPRESVNWMDTLIGSYRHAEPPVPVSALKPEISVDVVFSVHIEVPSGCVFPFVFPPVLLLPFPLMERVIIAFALVLVKVFGSPIGI